MKKPSSVDDEKSRSTTGRVWPVHVRGVCLVWPGMFVFELYGELSPIFFCDFWLWVVIYLFIIFWIAEEWVLREL